MKISDILSASDVLMLEDVSSKRELLKSLAVHAAPKAGIDERVLFDIVLERENLGSTVIGKGAALPHGRIPGLKHTQALFAKVKGGVDFNAADEQKSDLVFMLLSPEDSGADHLEALAKIAGIIKNEEQCSKLRHAASTAEIYKILTK
ncbi:MAG: PTS sugar transporter subunit IIA [Alphaproteobacteria bacterium]|nr:PTS sugar transporter subunit IIA [Alphaproteobacteria bacterium]